MFLHINTFGQQISLQSKDAEPARDAVPAVPEKKDEQGNVIQAAQEAVPAVPAKPAEPLKNVVREALNYWKRPETDIVVLSNNRRLSPDKTAEENGLKENDLIQVVSQKSLDDDVAAKKAIYDAALKLAGK